MIDYDDAELKAAVLAEFGHDALLRHAPQGVYGEMEICIRGKWYPCTLDDLNGADAAATFIDNLKRIEERIAA